MGGGFTISGNGDFDRRVIPPNVDANAQCRIEGRSIFGITDGKATNITDGTGFIKGNNVATCNSYTLGERLHNATGGRDFQTDEAYFPTNPADMNKYVKAFNAITGVSDGKATNVGTGRGMLAGRTIDMLPNNTFL